MEQIVATDQYNIAETLAELGIKDVNAGACDVISCAEFLFLDASTRKSLSVRRSRASVGTPGALSCIWIIKLS